MSLMKAEKRYQGFFVSCLFIPLSAFAGRHMGGLVFFLFVSLVSIVVQYWDWSLDWRIMFSLSQTVL